MLADTEFGTVEFLQAVQQRQWRAVVGMRGNRQMQNGKSLNQLYRSGRRGQQVCLVGLSKPLTVSWFWLKRSEGKRELRFVVSTYPYSGVYLVRLGRQRWAIEGFFKTIKHRFSLHRFGQSTRLGLYRWLVLSLVAFVLAHWTHCWARTQRLDWKAAGELAQAILLPQVIWKDLLHQIKINWDIAMQHGFEIVLKPIRWDY